MWYVVLQVCNTQITGDMELNNLTLIHRWKAHWALTTVQRLRLWARGWPRHYRACIWRSRQDFSLKRWFSHFFLEFWFHTTTFTRPCTFPSLNPFPGWGTRKSWKPADLWKRKCPHLPTTIPTLLPYHPRFCHCASIFTTFLVYADHEEVFEWRYEEENIWMLIISEPEYHKPERPSELDFSRQNKRQGFVFNHNWNLNKF